MACRTRASAALAPAACSPSRDPGVPVRQRLPVLLLIPSLALALGGCATSSAATSAVDDDDDAGTPAPGYSFAADNCGFEVTRSTPPERIVTIKSAMTEIVAALGAADRIVAVAYQDGELAAEDPLTSGEIALGNEQDLAGTIAAVPDLAERMPSRESVLALEPDLVLAGWESAFAPDAVGERSGLDALGVTTFVAPAACTQAPYLPDPLTFEDVFDQITQIGALLGTPQEAAAVVSESRTALAAAEANAREGGEEPGDGAAPSVLWWSSGVDTPYVGAGTGAPQMILEAAGFANVAGEVAGGWAPYSWEAAAAADPDYIVLVDSTWNTASDKKAALAANPVMAATRAVSQERYLVLPFATTEAGVRSVEAVWLLADQRAALG